MMKTPPLLVMLSLATLAAEAFAIDFTPRIADSIEDGVPMRRLYFTDDAQHIYYRPLPNWSRYGDVQGATFRPKDSGGEIRIQNAPAGNAGIAFDAHGLETFRQIAQSLVPSGASQVTEIWEAVNPVVLQGWTSFEIGFDYVTASQHSCRSILFINLDSKRQIQFIVDASPAEFSPLYSSAYRTLASWYQPVVAGAR
jgi:hypothetical protein